ncbi:unnamed protein product [Paramecium sonneborni]|uniref:Uncharacterized protein n=1 Tax=Paramecium sonneborni TaxID=65129 RepID=A0A8S1N628_9CILI|nr:unnamed protein product [Paramecium sonneborni]
MIKLKVNELSFRMSQMDCCFNKNKIFHIYKLSYCNKDPLLALLNFRGKNLLQSMIYRKDDFQIYSWKIWFFSINQGINNSQIQITTNTEIILHFSQLSFQQRLSSLIGFNGYYRILQKQWNDDESEFGGRDFPELKPWKVNDIFNFSWKIEQNRRLK